VEPRFADDCNSPLNVIEQGHRVVYDPEASAHEVAAESSTGLMRPVIWRRSLPVPHF
jgi:hypothetical protein